jgi:hypothetical protein
MKRYALLFLGLVLVMMIVSACSQSSRSTSSSLAPLEVLQKSANAMKNLKSLHFDLDGTFQVNGAINISSQTLSNTMVTVKGSGEQSIPDKQQEIDLTMTTPDLSTRVSDVVINDKVYLKIGQGQWYVVDKSSFNYTDGSYVGGVFSSTTTIDYNNLLSLIEDTEFTDHGIENLNGQSLRHITANIKQDALQQVVSDNLYLNIVKNGSASADVYIDENEFYVHRVVWKANPGTDDNSTTTSATPGLTIDLSKFNQPVTVTEPANAIPLTDPTHLLNGLSLDEIESWYGKQGEWIISNH